MKKVILLLLLTLSSSAIQSAVINVPADQPTIQDGINAAQHGDVVLVAEGEYRETVSFMGKEIIVAGLYYQDQDTSHISKTIISAPENIDPANGSIVSFVNSESHESVLIGFTITGGVGTAFGNGQRGGGGIFIDRAAPQILHNIIKENFLENDLSGYTLGGGICITQSNHLEFVIIDGNWVDSNDIAASGASVFGGGIFAGANVKILNNHITNNSVTYSGASVQVASGGGVCCKHEPNESLMDAIISDNIIENNYVKSSKASFPAGVDLLVTRPIFTDNIVRANVINSPSQNNIPGMRILSHTDSLLVEGNTFSENKVEGNARSVGGALTIVYPTRGVVKGNIFTKNESGECAGLELVSTQNIEVSYNEFKQNTASEHAGALNLSQSTGIRVFNNKFRDNSAQESAGACGMLQSEAVFYNNIFVGNTSQYGACFYIINDSEAQLMNNTLSDNSASVGGATVFAANNSKIRMLNMICWNDAASDEISLFNNTGTVMAAFSDIRGGYDGEGNIDIAPEFTESLSLAEDSPCIDAGRMTYELDGVTMVCPSFDFEKNPRPYPTGSAPDLGASEWRHPVRVDFMEFVPLLDKFILYPNFPNPFNPTTTIEYELFQHMHISLYIFDILGRRIKKLVDEHQEAGQYSVYWNSRSDDGDQVPAGLYFCKMAAEDYEDTIKLLLVK